VPNGPIFTGGCDAILLDPPERGVQLELPISVPVVRSASTASS
jgi:hypothetical protein